MKKNVAKIASIVLYTVSLVLVILFAFFCLYIYIKTKALSQNPLVELAPFSFVIKRLAIRFLVPATVCTMLGYLLQKMSKQ